MIPLKFLPWPQYKWHIVYTQDKTELLQTMFCKKQTHSIHSDIGHITIFEMPSRPYV
jgi:hypothetical protein